MSGRPAGNGETSCCLVGALQGYQGGIVGIEDIVADAVVGCLVERLQVAEDVFGVPDRTQCKVQKVNPDIAEGAMTAVFP